MTAEPSSILRRSSASATMGGATFARRWARDCEGVVARSGPNEAKRDCWLLAFIVPSMVELTCLLPVLTRARGEAFFSHRTQRTSATPLQCPGATAGPASFPRKPGAAYRRLAERAPCLRHVVSTHSDRTARGPYKRPTGYGPAISTN